MPVVFPDAATYVLRRIPTLPSALLLAVLTSFGAVAPSATQAQAQIGAPSAPKGITFNRDVAPILFEKCASCHRAGEAAPFSLLTYEDARQRARLIAQAVEMHVMPPWQPESGEGEFRGDRRLSNRERDTIRQWAEQGAREGDAVERPAAPTFTSGWQLGTPDVVVDMPEALTLPADGPDVFRNFALPIPLAERRYVRAIEFRPGNPRVLHHARLLLDDTGDIRRLDQQDPSPGFGGMDVPGARFPDGHFLGWAPGRSPSREAFPWPLEPGNDLVIQMHLKPSGRLEVVQASVGLYFTDTAPSRVPIMLRLGSKTIDIPAGATRYEVTDRFDVPIDVTALSIYPHAHYLATEMLVTARKPNKTTITLLRIPRWNFNWQDEYTYTRPVVLPRGTVVEMRYVYDNSATNPFNPSSPPQRVRFGSETRDEMGELLIQVLPTGGNTGDLRAAIARKNLLMDIAGEEKLLADEPENADAKVALGVHYVQDGRVSEAVEQFRAALRIRPDHAKAHYNLGVIAMGESRVADAAESFRSALRTQPDYVEALNNLGVALEASGRGADAEAQFRAALQARPNHSAAHNNLGRLLLARRDVPGALAEFRATLKLRPDNADALYNLGRALVADGKVRDAVQQWHRAIAARPDSLIFMLDLAWTLATEADVLDGPEAIRLAQRANRMTNGQNPVALDVLAAAYAADRRHDLAVQTAQLALQRALAASNSALATEIRQRLSAYQEAQGGAGDSGNP